MAAVIEPQAAHDDERLIVESFASPRSAPPTTKLTFEQANKLAGGASFELIHVYVVKSRRNPVGPTGSCVIFQTSGLGTTFYE